MPAGDLSAWTQLLGALALVLGAVATLARLILKRFPPRSTTLAEDVKQAKGDVAEARTEVAAMRLEVAACRGELRLLTDYAHDLREHIALDKKPPPPDWPEGLRL